MENVGSGFGSTWTCSDGYVAEHRGFGSTWTCSDDYVAEFGETVLPF